MQCTHVLMNLKHFVNATDYTLLTPLCTLINRLSSPNLRDCLPRFNKVISPPLKSFLTRQAPMMLAASAITLRA